MIEFLHSSQQALGSPASVIGFLICVAVAAYTQTLTGFAFGLVLLSTVAILDLAPIVEATNAAMMLTLVNAYSYFRQDRQPPPWRIMRPALIGSLSFTLVGVAVVMWLSSNAAQSLKILLGAVIVACALSLALHRHPRKTLSSPVGFGIAGAMGGLLGGMFGTSGPPIAYLLYRQPLEHVVIRRTLLVIFASGSALRLIAVVATGALTLRAFLLFALSVPVVHYITVYAAKRPSPVSARTLQVGVSSLLVVTGVLLIFTGWRAL